MYALWDKSKAVWMLCLDVLNVLRRMSFEEWWQNARAHSLPSNDSYWYSAVDKETMISFMQNGEFEECKIALYDEEIKKVIDKIRSNPNPRLKKAEVIICNKVMLWYGLCAAYRLIWFSFRRIWHNIELRRRNAPYVDIATLAEGLLPMNLVNEIVEARDIYIKFKDLDFRRKELKKMRMKIDDDNELENTFINDVNSMCLEVGYFFLFFDIINVPIFMPVMYSEEIVDILRESQFKTFIQQQYNIYALQHPNAPERVFDCINIVRQVLPNNFDNIAAEKKDSLGLNLNKSQIECLYSFLYQKGYIDLNTDIYNFAYVLTGKPKRQRYKKIMWKQNMQSLSFWLGMIRVEEGKYGFWTDVCKLFDYELPLDAKKLSSSFNKMENKKQDKKNEIWVEFENLISKIKKIGN